MRIVLCLAVLVVPISAANAASLPGDSANGMRLFNANCTGCHDTSVLTRPDRAVQSLDALKKQIAGCAHMANKQFSETEARDLLKYLNDQSVGPVALLADAKLTLWRGRLYNRSATRRDHRSWR